MDKKLGETTNLCVEIINSKRQVSKGETGSRGTNSSLPFDLSTNEKFVWLAHTNFLRNVSGKKD